MRSIQWIGLAACVIAIPIVILFLPDGAEGGMEIERAGERGAPVLDANSNSRTSEVVTRSELPPESSGPPASSSLSVGAESEEPRQLEIEMASSVLGRVLDPRGQPVEGADVFLRALDAGANRSFSGRGSTDAEGRFSIETLTTGTCELTARKRQLGSSRALQSDLGPRDRWDAGDLLLQGGGELHGRVLFPTGEAVGVLRIHAVRTEGTQPTPGLARSQLSTDAQGAFHFTGLSPGSEYQLEHSLAAVAPFGERGRARTDGPQLRLVLDAGRVTVRAVDDEGATVEVRTITLLDAETDERISSESWASLQQSVVLYLTPQRQYLVSAKDEDNQRYEALVELTPGELEREVLLHAPQGQELSTLRLRILDPRGEELSEFNATLRAKVGDGWVSLSAPGDLEDGAFAKLESGVHELRVQISRLPWKSMLYFDPSWRSVELYPGQETRLELATKEGGRVELDLSGVPKLVARHSATLTGRKTDSDEEAFEALRAYRHTGESTTFATHPRLGEAWRTARSLPPGSWTLRLKAEGYLPWERTVLVRAGELTTIQVALEAR